MPIGSMAGWEFVPHFSNGKVAAIAALLGTEIHFCVSPHWRCRVIAKTRTREFLRPMLERRGYLTTSAIKGGISHEFLDRLGFKRTWDDGSVSHYMLTELPFRESQSMLPAANTSA